MTSVRPAGGHRRELVAERLAATRCHDGERIPAFEDRCDNLFLERQEPGVTPVFFEKIGGRGHAGVATGYFGGLPDEFSS